MKNIAPKIYWFLFIGLFLVQCESPQQEIVTQGWPEINSATKPWARWWWMGNAVNKKDIGAQLTAFSQADFGGVEITPIYGVMDYEDQYIDYLSDEWMDVLQFTITKADELGLGVDMNLGTGWPFGGPQIAPEYAASILLSEKYTLKKGEKLNEKIVTKDPRQNQDDVELLALTANFSDGNIVDIRQYVNDQKELDWVPEQDCEIYAAFNGKTRQKVKRAAPGGEGWSMDHFSKTALETYLERFDAAFSKIPNRPRAYFNDSYEVYGSSGTKDIFIEFEKRRGYDLKLHLKELFSKEDTESARRIQSDYRLTFSELLMNEFTLPWKEWSNYQEVKARNQAHGSPGNIIDLYGVVDIPECETFGSSFFPIPGLRRDSSDIRPVDPDPIMMKFATSAANVLGKDYVSSETFTWLAEHFRVSLSQCKPELEQVFLAGVNHVFYHGITYSPQDAAWPGWLFYASVQFGPVNSFWPHIHGLNEYIERSQSVLQQGKADSDMLMYWPIYDVWNNVGRLDQQISIHNIDEWLHPTPFYKDVKQLMNNGYLVDFVSDNILSSLDVNNGTLSANSDGSVYKTLIIPSCELMPLATLEKVIDLAYNGATVIFQNLPEDVPGFHDLEKDRDKFKEIYASLNESSSKGKNHETRIGKGKIIINSDIEVALNTIAIPREKLVDTGLKFIRRVNDDDRYYFLVNHTPATIKEQIPLNTKLSNAILMDPDNGDFGRTSLSKKDDQVLVDVQLEPGQSIIIRCTDKDASQIPEWHFIGKTEETKSLTGPWKLTFTGGGPELPDTTTLEHLVSWTELPDEKAVYFSGQGVYEYALMISDEPADEYILNLGKVAESARVWINDQEVGVLWSIPFEARIGKYLKKGENSIKIEVANLMANRIRYMDQQGIVWRKFHEINFVNIDYEPFDASGWKPMPSGLLGPVALKAVAFE